MSASQIRQHDVAASRHLEVVGRVLGARLRGGGPRERARRRVAERLGKGHSPISVGVAGSPQRDLEMVREEAAADGGRLLSGFADCCGRDERRSLHQLFGRQREVDCHRGTCALDLRQFAGFAGVDDGHLGVGGGVRESCANLVVADALVGELEPGASCMTGEVDDEQGPLTAGAGLGHLHLRGGQRVSQFCCACAAQDGDVVVREVAQLVQGLCESLGVALGEPELQPSGCAAVVAGNDREARRGMDG